MRVQLSAMLLGLVSVAGELHAGPPVRWSVGVNIGGPVYRPYPYHYHYHPYPRPYYYYAPAPIVLEPAPVVVRPAPVVVTSPPPAVVTSSPQAASYESARPVVQDYPSNSAIDGHLANLRHPDESVRRNSVMELGRMRAQSAVEPLTATLAGDQSASVRDAAARALGLISSPRAMTALLHSAQADPDRDVRNSAQFAVEILRTNPR